MEHYFTRRPRTPLNLRLIHTVIRGIPFKFYTGSSVFSPKKIDNGTKLLAEKMIIPKNSKVLDIGCGYGVLGIVAGKICKSCEIFMSDINERAVMLAIRNCKANGIRANVKSGNLYKPWKMKFDVILSNPPMSAGKETCIEIIKGAKEHLIEGGSIQIVVKYRKGGKAIGELIKDIFGNVEVLGKKGGYRVFRAVSL